MCFAIGQPRPEELSDGVRRHLDTGEAVLLLTLTLRHRAGLALGHVLDVLSRARGRLVQGYRWRQIAKKIGLVGWVRATEITVSDR